LVCTFRIAARPARSGRWTTTRRSKRPGRTKACGQDDDALAGVETVHLRQDLVQRLLALVVSAELHAAPARAADGVQFIDEDDGRRRFPRLLEQVPHTRGPDPHDHLDELGGAETEKGHARLPGNGPRQQRLARSGRPD
jgi:hypothetical protein